jgi:hypothetical protein
MGLEKKPCQPVITKKIKQELMPFTDVPILLSLTDQTAFVKALEATVKCMKIDNNVLLHLNSMSLC